MVCVLLMISERRLPLKSGHLEAITRFVNYKLPGHPTSLREGGWWWWWGGSNFALVVVVPVLVMHQSDG